MRVWYQVRDFEAGRDFYRRVLGFEETAVDFESKCAELERNGMQIALTEGEPAANGAVATLDVDDIKAEADRLRAEAVQVGTVLELTGQIRLVDIFDPDGNRIQLTQPID